MTCMEEDGVKRVLFKVIFPAILIAVWLITCYQVCNKAEGFDWFLCTAPMLSLIRKERCFWSVEKCC